LDKWDVCGNTIVPREHAMKFFTASASLALVVASSSAANFDWENLAAGAQASVSQTDGALTATATGIGANISVFNMGVNAGFESFETRSLIGALDGNGDRVGIKVSFSSLVTGVTADVGDASADNDGTITLAAYDSSDNFLVSASFVYGTSVGVINLGVFASNIAYVLGTTDAGTANGKNSVVWDNFTATPVPEPATMAALGLGAAALLRRRRK